MPADYKSAAQALSLTIDEDPLSSTSRQEEEDMFEDEPSSNPPPPASVPWTRSSRRLSTPYSLNSRSNNNNNTSSSVHNQVQLTVTSLFHTAHTLTCQSLGIFNRLTPLQKILAVTGLVALTILFVLGAIYNHEIFAWLGPIAKGWRDLRGGWLLVWAMTFATAFPPVIGYSTTCTIAGFVYGFPLGWPIVMTATVAGSTVAFLTSRTIFSGYVHALVGEDKRFVALGQVLRHDGLLVLAAVRFCPLPYSLSNGFLSTIPSIQPWSFAVATALASPKLLVHVFIGSRLAIIAEKGDQMSAGDEAINYISMFVGGLVGAGVGFVIYRRTMARAEELAREEVEANGRLGPRGIGEAGVGGEYADSADSEDARLMMMDPDEVDAAALMDDDDISLWESDPDGLGGAYRDEEAAIEGNGGQNGLGK